MPEEVELQNNEELTHKPWLQKGPWRMPKWELNEDIVVSGISGRFPEADNVEELKRNLFEGVDMISENNRRWTPGLLGTPHRTGKLKDIKRFDSKFFGINDEMANAMDPQQRILLEVTYEAIFDAGIEPNSLRGKHIGMFLGCSEICAMENKKLDPNLGNTYDLEGLNLGMLAHRISAEFEFTGPCFCLDTACSSSFHALNQAVLSLRSNRCEAAIVAGSTISVNLLAAYTFSKIGLTSANGKCMVFDDRVKENSVTCFNNHCEAAIVAGSTISVNLLAAYTFSKIGLTSANGKCMVFDDRANGYVRSEGVGAILLQRASQAKRQYFTIMHIKLNNDGAKPEGITFPGAHIQKQLYREVYSELDLDPSCVSYLEAHGTGTVAGDREESNAIAEFFLEGRDSPLPIGSVKSNLGHAEAASGMESLAKIIITMEEGFIPPNLNYTEANKQVLALVEGRLSVVDKITPWKPGFVAVNNFGFGGSNAHAVVKCNAKIKTDKDERKIARLVLACGRSHDAVQYILNQVREKKFTDEAVSLLEDASMTPTSRMRFRGYTFLDESKEKSKEVITKSPVEPPHIWFMFCTTSVQSYGWLRTMMKFYVFANTIEICARILKPYGIVQLALTEMVKVLGISAAGIISDSLGELTFAYTNGYLTLENVLMRAYWQEKYKEHHPSFSEVLAVIGLSWSEAGKRCPKGISLQSRAGHRAVTISGPPDKIQKFLKELHKDKIFFGQAPPASPDHYIQHSDDGLKFRQECPSGIENYIPCISVLGGEKRSSEESFMTDNVSELLKSALLKVPSNALIIDFSLCPGLDSTPEFITQAKTTYLPLLDKKDGDCLNYCLSIIGKLYTLGLNPTVKNLYDPIEYPVSRATPMLNSLIKWNHSDEWHIKDVNWQISQKNSIFIDTTRDSSFKYILQHKVNGKVLIPSMALVSLVWRSYGDRMEFNCDNTSVIIEDLCFKKPVFISKTDVIRLEVNFLEEEGKFQIVENREEILTGKIRHSTDNVHKFYDKVLEASEFFSDEVPFILKAEDFYKELRLRGYEYGRYFQSVKQVESSGLQGVTSWEGHWVPFMESLLQISVFSFPNTTCVLPSRITSIRIEPKLISENGKEIAFTMNKNINFCKAGPLEIQGLEFSGLPFQSCDKRETILEENVFIPLFYGNVVDSQDVKHLEDYSHACSTIVNKIIKNLNLKIDEIYLQDVEEASETVLEYFITSSEPEYGLLKCLQEIAEATCKNTIKSNTETELSYSDTHRDILNILHKNRDCLCVDVLNNYPVCDNRIRNFLEIVSSNSPYKVLKVLEVQFNSSLHNSLHGSVKKAFSGCCYDYLMALIGQEESETIHIKDFRASRFGALHQIPKENYFVLAKHVLTRSGLHPKQVLRDLAEATRDGGFIILIERTKTHPAEIFLKTAFRVLHFEQKTQELEVAFADVGLCVVGKKDDCVSSIIYLLRKIPKEDQTKDNHMLFFKPESKGFNWIEDIKKKIRNRSAHPDGTRLWLVSNRGDHGLLGLYNCLKLEEGGQFLRVIVNETSEIDFRTLFFEKNSKIMTDVFRKDLIMNIYKDGQWGTMSYHSISNRPSLQTRTQIFLNMVSRADANELEWTESSLNNFGCLTSENEKLVTVYYAAINKRDLLLKSGRIASYFQTDIPVTQDGILGIEFSGRDKSGLRIMGIVSSQAMATSVVVSDKQILPVPDTWTLEEASSVPVAYLTAYYALIIKGNLKAKESVLIHCGSGAVGQAATTIALALGCVVFVTVGTEKKKDFMKTTFPELEDGHICYSRNDGFQTNILNATKGTGVNFVLNSLRNKGFQASLGCLQLHGRFVDIATLDADMDDGFGMAILQKNCTISRVMFAQLLEDNKKAHEELQLCMDLLRKGIETQTVKPISSTVFQWNNATDAFAFMEKGEHVGKVVLKIRDEESEKACIPQTSLFLAAARTYFHPKKSYLVLGDVTSLGLELVKWLVERGARNIVLSSRIKERTGYVKLWLQRWKAKGIILKVLSQEACTIDNAKALIHEASKLGLLDGIFHVELALQSEFFMNVKEDRFQRVCDNTSGSVQNLDIASRQICRALSYFVVFSSLASVTGSAGKTLSGYACSLMDHVVTQRKALGLSGLAIQWGMIGDVGPDYETTGRNDAVLKGTVSQRFASCMDVLDRFLQEDYAVVSSFESAEEHVPVLNGSDVMREICETLGMNDKRKVNPETSFSELNLCNQKLRNIQEMLLNSYGFRLPLSVILHYRLKDLEFAIIRGDLRQDYVTKCLSKPTVSTRTQLEMAENIMIPLNDVSTFGGKSSCLFFVHSLEGHVQMFKAIAQLIKVPTYGLQFTSHVPFSTIQDIAKCYVEHVKTVQSKGPYKLCGYGFGTLIALEIALQLQETDQVTLICIDGSPHMAKDFSKLWLTDNKREKDMALIPYMMVVKTYFTTVSEEGKYLNHDASHFEDHQMRNSRIYTGCSKSVVHLGTPSDRKMIVNCITMYVRSANSSNRKHMTLNLSSRSSENYVVNSEINGSKVKYKVVALPEKTEDFLKYNILNSEMTENVKVDKFMTLFGLRTSQDTIKEVLRLNRRMADATSSYEITGKITGNSVLIKSKCPPLECHLKSYERIFDYNLKKSITGYVEVLEMNCDKSELLEENAESLAVVINSRIAN